MKALVALVSAAFLSACGGYGDEYTVHIHPDFGSKTEWVLESMNKWNDGVGVSLTPVVENPRHCNSPGNICVYIINLSNLDKMVGHSFPDGFWTGLTHRDYDDYANVYILDLLLINYPDPMSQQGARIGATRTIMHELGHALGLDHDPHANTIMCKQVGCESDELSCLDKKQYFNLRGIDYYCN